MKDYIKLIRIKHWIKNFLIVIPLVCANVINLNNIYKVGIGLLSFSFMCSFIYIINDIRDIEKDKKHPLKKNRPLASGKIKKSTAMVIAILMIVLSLILNCVSNNSVLNTSLYFLVAYMIINIFYSCGLKNVAILDVALLASGFVIRIYYGAALIDVAVSDWLFLTVLNASLFLGLGKRRKELENTKESRKVLDEYNAAFLDKFQYLTLGLVFVFYSLWAIDQDVKYLFLTIPLLMVIFMKYCLIIEKSEEGDPTTILYQDKVLLALCLLYGIAMVLLLVVL